MKKQVRATVQAVWKKAASMQTRAASAVSSYHNLENAVTTDVAWSWANGVELNNLMARKLTVDTFAKTAPFWQDFFLLDCVSLKKKYDEKESSKQLLSIEECNKALEALEKQVNKMACMHSAFLLHQ